MSLSVNDVDFGEQNIIYVTSDREKTYGVEWTIPATEELLRLLKKYMKLFQNGKLRTKKQLYENISAAMADMGLFYSGTQCENKWKSLKRTFLTKYEKGGTNRRFPNVKGPYESQVEELLRIERPSFKKELDELVKVDLNIPPGFVKAEVYSESDDQEQEYSQNDEELVQLVLREPSAVDENSKDDNASNLTEYLAAPDNDKEHNYSYSYNLGKKNSAKLVKEIIELKKVVKKNLETNTEVLSNYNATQEQILTYLDTVDKREEEKIELKRRKLDKQDELVHQIKIQNSLIAKLIQKLGNNK